MIVSSRIKDDGFGEVNVNIKETFLIIVESNVIIAMEKLIAKFGNWMEPTIVCPKIPEHNSNLDDHNKCTVYNYGGVISIKMNVLYIFDIMQQIKLYMKKETQLFGISKLEWI